MRAFRVGTFAENAQLSKIRTYTMWYSPEWEGCIEYVIEAKNGTEAKRLARLQRRKHELAKEKVGEPS